MRVTLDDEVCPVDSAFVGEAVAAAAAMAESRGRVIIEVEVDGSPWSQEQLQGIESNQTAASEVCLRSADPGILVAQTFAEAGDALEEAGRLQEQCAALLDADQPVDAMDRLGDALHTWMSVQQAVTLGASLLDLDLDSVRVDNQALPDLVVSLNEKLQSVRDALAAQDPVSLSDTLQYELPETVQQWSGVLRHLQGLIEGSR